MRLRPNRLWPALAALAAALLLAAGPDDRALDAAVRQLHDSVTPRRDGSNLALLMALRQMRDSTLRACFYQLAHHEDPQVQLQAVLGLAEIDPTHSIDPWLVRQVRAPAAQRLIVTAAIESDLVGAEQMRELLKDEGVEPGARALLAAALAGTGAPVEAPLVVPMAAAPDPTVSGLAACALAQLGSTAALGQVRERVSAAPGQQQLDLLRLIASCELTAVADFVAEWAVAATDPQVQAAGVEALLELDPGRGAEAWASSLGREPDRPKAIRAALQLLGHATEVPASAWDRLPGGDPMLERVLAAGRALSRGDGQAEALVALLRFEHPAAAMWAMAAARQLQGDQAAEFCRAVLDDLDGPPEGEALRIERAILAAARLFELAPTEIQSRLAAAEDDSSDQVAILMGLLDSPSPDAAAAAAATRRIGFGRADSIATIIIAKHAAALDPEELRRLGFITAGGSGISEILQIQAAWLYLRHTSQIDLALSSAFAARTP